MSTNSQNPHLRFLQRFQNFETAFLLLQKLCRDAQDTTQGSQYYDAVQMALVQSFEIVVELSWKTMKDYLENLGFSDIHNGKTAIRYALRQGIIENGEAWLDAIDLRNITSHSYDQAVLVKINDFISSTFIHQVSALYEKLRGVACPTD